jgi:type II secretory pathway component PulM
MKSAFFDSLGTLWHSREPRERTLVALAAVVIVIGGLYAWVLDPALTTNRRLKTELPATHVKLAHVQSLAIAAKANASSNVAAPSQANLQASLSAASISATVSAAPPWVITVNAATGDALWTWIKTHATNKTTLKRSATGNWSGELTLE